MGELTSQERACVEAASDAPMLAQVQNWSEVNSGSRNLEGLATLGARLAGAFAALPGEIRMVDPAPVEAIDPAGKAYEVPHGRNRLELALRLPASPVDAESARFLAGQVLCGDPARGPCAHLP